MLSEQIVLEATKQGFQAVAAWFKRELNQERLVYADIETALCDHLSFVKNWCQDFMLFDMPKSKALADIFVQPSFVEGASRPAKTAPRRSFHYHTLLKGGTHRVVFGYPGAGKTTLIQRLCSDLIFRNLPESSECQYDFPLLIRFRTIAPDQTLTQSLLSTLGISLNPKLKDKRFPKDDDTEWTWHELEERTLIEFLNARSVLILLDGFDELRAELREGYRRELEELSFRIHNSDFVLTTRTGTTLGTLGRTQHYFIQPFDDKELRAYPEIGLFVNIDLVDI